MVFIKNRLVLIISAIVILFLLSGAYLLGILCIGKFCANKASFQVNKLVANPDTKVMVDNLNPNDSKYAKNSIVKFQLRIINTSEASIRDIVVKDTFPKFIDFNGGAGAYDLNAKTLTFNVDLEPKEVKVFDISGKVSNNLSFSQNVLCVENEVNATAKNMAGASDRSQFCIDKKLVLKENSSTLTSTPATGPESLTLFFLIPAGILGWSLRKYSKGGIN